MSVTIAATGTDGTEVLSRLSEFWNPDHSYSWISLEDLGTVFKWAESVILECDTVLCLDCRALGKAMEEDEEEATAAIEEKPA